jgi:sulfatase modifying factor 1
MKHFKNLKIYFSITLISSIVLVNFSFNYTVLDNSTGLQFVKIPKGDFLMGADIDPSYIVANEKKGWKSIFIQDEFPIRRIKLSLDFEISKYEVTNAQYEQFDSKHRDLRGNFMNISTLDNEAVVYVSWEDAYKYTQWLSKNDADYDYRLPTEAEWEYVCRAGTRTAFNDGLNKDIYKNNPFSSIEMESKHYKFPYPFTWSNGCRNWVTWTPEECIGVDDVYPNKTQIKDADLTIGMSQPNNFGVYDMHGNVEEWVSDWYGLYDKKNILNPLGPSKGDFKVIRGGSHNNHVQHARSSNRMSSAINDKNYFVGFRVVRTLKTKKISQKHSKNFTRNWSDNVKKKDFKWNKDSNEPTFYMESVFELIPKLEDGSHYGSPEQLRQFGFDGSNQKPLLTGPLYTHNHSPTITWCRNGDVFMSWFTGESEVGPELSLVATRGIRSQNGKINWTYPSEFLKAADRNMHSSNIIIDKNGVLHQMSSIGLAGRWDKLALGYRRSMDNGATWSPVRMVLELDHGFTDGCSMQGNMFEKSNGDLVFIVDDKEDGTSNTGSIVTSSDGGNTWYRKGHSSTTSNTLRIAGLHSAVIEINDINGDKKNDLLAIARDNGAYFGGKAPQSISIDGGETWQRSASVFPSIKGEQRFSLLRLPYSQKLDGKQPILFVGFANEGIQGRNAEGKLDTIRGLYVSLSYNEGKTWPSEYRKVVSDITGSNEKTLEIAPWQKKNVFKKAKSLDIGYMSATQSPDGLIHLTDGKLVFTFNTSWINQKSN